MTLDDLQRLLDGCPHGEGCEHDCPMRRLRETDRDRAVQELHRVVQHDQREIEQIHLLCVRNRRLRCNDRPL